MSNPLTDNFEIIRLALLKSPSSRSYDDLLCLRGFIFQIEWIKNHFQETVHLGPINDFCRYLSIEEYAAGATLYNQDEPSDRMFFIVDGHFELRVRYRVDLTNNAYEERERIEHRIQSGMTFGHEVLSSATRSNTAVCVSKCGIALTASKSCMRMLEKELNVDGQEPGITFKPDSKNFVLSVLSKRRHCRTAFEIDATTKFLKHRIPFFERFTVDQQQELCRIAETVSLRDKKILFKQGQVGQAFYIVLSGGVDVFVWQSDGSGHASGSNSVSGESVHTTSTALSALEGIGQLVHTVTVGETFGDRALDSPTALRTATVVSKVGTTELLVIYKEDYYNIVSVIRERASMDKIVLLRKSPVFKNADMSLLKAMAKVMTPRMYQLDEVLYREGDRALDMIIIAVGECRAEVEIYSEHEHVEKASPSYLRGTARIKKTTDTITNRNISPTTGMGRDSFDAEVETSNDLVDQCTVDSRSAITGSVTSKRIRGGKAFVGRLGPASILSPFVAFCESIQDEVFHEETIVAETLLQTFVVFKNDFIHHIPEPHRSSLRKVLREMPSYLMPQLWDLHAMSMGEQEWKAKKAWDMFKRDIRKRRGNIKSTITSKLASLEHVHRIDAQGHRLRSSEVEQKVAPVINSKLNHTLAGFTETFHKRSAQELAEIRRVTSKFNKDELVEVEIAAANRRNEERDMQALVTSQPIIRKQNEDIQIVAEPQEFFGSTRATIVYPASAAELKLNSSVSTEVKEDVDISFQTKSLVLTSHYPVFQYPFSLIHIHRDVVDTENKAILPRVSFCYYRLGGVMQTLLEAKISASQQMKHAYISCLTHDTEISQPEIILDWKTFCSFDTMGVSNTDFFVAYFRSVPIEFASFTPKVNLLNKLFPAEVKIPGQNFACARFATINPHAHLEGADRDVLRPKFIQELGILNEVLAATFDLAECCQFVLESTTKGSEIRQNFTATMQKPADLVESSILFQPPRTPSRERRPNLAESTRTADEYDDDEVENEKVVMCVIPLYQWISMAPDAFDSMRIENLLFSKHSRDLIDPSLRSDENSGKDVGYATSTLAQLKYSLREVGLLAKHDAELPTEITIVERNAIRQNEESMKATPGLKLVESTFSHHDYLLDVDALGRAKTLAHETSIQLGSVKSTSKIINKSAGSLPIAGSLGSRVISRPTRHTPSTVDISHTMEDKLHALRHVTDARTAAVLLNDDFCYGEVYTPWEDRQKTRIPSVASSRISKIVEDNAWDPDKLCDRSRQIREELSDYGKKTRFRHNPLVAFGVDRGAADGHLTLLDTLQHLPSHHQLLAKRLDSTKASVMTNTPLLSKSSSTSALGRVRDRKTLNCRLNVVNSTSTGKLPLVGATSLSTRLDTLQEALNAQLNS